MSEIARILDQMDRAFSGDAWHGPSLMVLIDGVSAEDAAKRGIPQAHSIWEIVQHIVAWNTIVRRRLKNEIVQVTPEMDWPPLPEVSERAWKRTLAQLKESREELRRAAAEIPDVQLDEKPPNLPDSRYVLVHGLIQHDLYHAGQIAILKKALRYLSLGPQRTTWPRTAAEKMMGNADSFALLAAVALVLSWIGFGVILIIGRTAASHGQTKRDNKSHAGFALQCAAYLTIFAFHRDYFSALFPNGGIGDVVLPAVIVAIVVVSEWFCFAAARILGKQWALVARVIPDHQLIQQGPYAVVRNPIYLAMFGNVLATGLAFGTWMAIIAALVVFTVGTEIRIRSEERILREAFGAEFEDYARHVPSFFPGVR